MSRMSQIVAMAITLAAGASLPSAANANPFSDLQKSAPNSVFTDLDRTAPRSRIFDHLQRNAP